MFTAGPVPRGSPGLLQEPRNLSRRSAPCKRVRVRPREAAAPPRQRVSGICGSNRTAAAASGTSDCECRRARSAIAPSAFRPGVRPDFDSPNPSFRAAAPLSRHFDRSGAAAERRNLPPAVQRPTRCEGKISLLRGSANRFGRNDGRRRAPGGNGGNGGKPGVSAGMAWQMPLFGRNRQTGLDLDFFFDILSPAVRWVRPGCPERMATGGLRNPTGRTGRSPPSGAGPGGPAAKGSTFGTSGEAPVGCGRRTSGVDRPGIGCRFRYVKENISILGNICDRSSNGLGRPSGAPARGRPSPP